MWQASEGKEDGVKQAHRRNEHAKRTREKEGEACQDTIVFFIFYVQNVDVKILIGQIFVSVKALLFSGINDLKQNVQWSRTCMSWVGYEN